MGIKLVKYGVNSDSGIYNHDELMNRELPDQHPVESITGLETILSDINIAIDNVTGIDNAIDTETLDLSYDKTTKSLTGSVKVSQEPKNALIVKQDGLFVKASASSLVEVIQTNHGFTDLKILYLKSNGVYSLASSAKKATSEALGLVKVVDANNFELITSGLYETDVTAYTIGTPLFLSTIGTLTTNLTSDIKVIKLIGTVVKNGILININEGFLKEDFEIITTSPSVQSDTTLSVSKTYPYLSVIDFNIDVPYNKFILRGFEILMGRSHATGSIPNNDAYHFSIRNSIYEPNISTNFVKKTVWNSTDFIGLQYINGVINVVDAGGYYAEGQTGFSASGVEYEDYDGTYQVHLRIWCYGGTSSGAASNTIYSIRTYIQTIEE